jgi:hypothetical protein
VQNDRDSVYVNSADAAVEPEGAPDHQRQFVMANIKAALVTSRLTLSANNPGVDPYNSRLGKRANSVWNGHRR